MHHFRTVHARWRHHHEGSRIPKPDDEFDPKLGYLRSTFPGSFENTSISEDIENLCLNTELRSEDRDKQSDPIGPKREMSMTKKRETRRRFNTARSLEIITLLEKFSGDSKEGDSVESPSNQTSQSSNTQAHKAPDYKDQDCNDSLHAKHGRSRSPSFSENLVIMKSKHDLLVSLMKQVYSQLGHSDLSNLREHGQSQQREAGRSGVELGASKPNDTKGKSVKRGKRDEESFEGNDDRKRRQTSSSASSITQEKLFYACPFNKHDAVTFQPRASSNFRYRSCIGPGFQKISHVK